MFFYDFFYVVMLELWFLFFVNKSIVVDEIIIVDLVYFFVIVIYKCDIFIYLCILLIFCIVDIVFGFKYVIVLV